MQGKTREQAFRIGHEIADAVTALNPAPVKLKFEKVLKHTPSFIHVLKLSGVSPLRAHGKETLRRLQIREYRRQGSRLRG